MRNSARSRSGAGRDFSLRSWESLSTLYDRDDPDNANDQTSVADQEERTLPSESSYAALASSEPVNPPDVDYTVREMDLYYHQRREATFGEEPPKTLGNRIAIGFEPVAHWWSGRRNP